jgi:hypothetical protein
MTQQPRDPITKPEWGYLTPEARELAMKLRYEMGVDDIDLAVELAVAFLGEELSYALEE